MRWLSQWRAGPIATLMAAWVACSAATLSLYVAAQARSAGELFEDIGRQLGATSSSVHVRWLDMWPQLLGYYLLIVVLPPTVLWLLWRRARREAARPTS